MGSLVISLDVELGWGLWHVEPFPLERVDRARRSWRRLRRLFDDFGIPATWAIVGHLFLRDCHHNHREHPAGTRCCTRPASAADDAWFGGELVDEIVTSPVDHDVGAHGFTHVHFQHEIADSTFAERELRRTREAAGRRDVNPDSFVFPVNKVGHREVLKRNGIRCYRGRQPTRVSGMRKALAASMDRWMPPLVQPTVDEYGLVNVPASLYLFSMEGRARSVIGRIRGDPVVNAVSRGLDALAERDGVLHLWLHPNNLTTEADFERIRSIAEHAAALRDEGEIRVESMRDVADRERGEPRWAET